MSKEFSIIIPIKNRTCISVDYEKIPLRVLKRNTLVMSGLGRKEFKNKDEKITLELLLNFLESLTKIKNIDESLEIVLTDFGSDDYNLQKLIPKFPELQFKIIYENTHFSRGRGLNIGYKNATKSNIFFCDADMLLNTRELFDRAYEEINNGKVLFPICFGLCEPSHQVGYWRNSGYGMCLLSKQTLEDNNYKWSEYDALGKEDDDFWDFFNKRELCSRYQINGYYHQWHPESQEFKNRYYKNNDIHKKKVFINCDEKNIDKIKLVNLLNDLKMNEYYVTFCLEKFVTDIVEINGLEKIVSSEDITNYINKHNKKTILHQYTLY